MKTTIISSENIKGKRKAVQVSNESEVITAKDLMSSPVITITACLGAFSLSEIT